MRRPRLEVADIFHRHGAAWRRANAGHVEPRPAPGDVGHRELPLGRRSAAMSSAARTAATRRIAYNSCRNRHCPKCQGAAAQGLACRPRGRSAAGRLFPPRLHAAGRDRPDRLPEQGGGLRPAVPHRGRDAAHDRRRSQAPRRPHRRHRRAPQLGLGDDPPSARPHDRAGRRDIARRHALGALQARLPAAGAGALPPVPAALPGRARRRPRGGPAGVLRRDRGPAATERPSPPISRRCGRKNWFVYAKPPFAGPEAVLAYLARYTHRVAIANSRLLALDERGVTFRYKDYRRNGQARYRTMTLGAGRVHPALPAPRPAQGVPPHPPLRAARQRRLQGQYRARQGADRRARAVDEPPASTTTRTRPPARQPTIARHALAAAAA